MSGLSGKQNLLFPSGSDIKCVIFYEKTKGQVPLEPLLGMQNIHAKGVCSSKPLTQALKYLTMSCLVRRPNLLWA